MLTSVKIPSTESIQFHKIESFTTNSRETHPKFDVSQVPIYIHVDHIQSNFVYVSNFKRKVLFDKMKSAVIQLSTYRPQKIFAEVGM